MELIEHASGCPMHSPPWLRHAIAVAGRLVSSPDVPRDGEVDQASAGHLMDALALLAETDDWSTVTLWDVARYATMDEAIFGPSCRCHAFDRRRGAGENGHRP
jgi:hypothetical protein